jgi:phosphatidylserine/phosphatidylglycerophosphate/cardiolipin synthase-like enzyme
MRTLNNNSGMFLLYHVDVAQNLYTQLIMTAFFDNISESFLAALEELQPAALVGCQFFFSDSAVIEYLKRKRIPVSIIVQKQKLWKCRSYNPRKRYQAQNAMQLRTGYDALTPLPGESAAVRCYGPMYSTRSKRPTPILHHKVFIFLDALNQPFALFTGSYNFSNWACKNEENALLIKSPTSTLRAYVAEWQRLKDGSEPLDF